MPECGHEPDRDQCRNCNQVPSFCREAIPGARDPCQRPTQSRSGTCERFRIRMGMAKPSAGQVSRIPSSASAEKILTARPTNTRAFTDRSAAWTRYAVRS